MFPFNWCVSRSARRGKRFRQSAPRTSTTVASTGSMESRRAATVCSPAILLVLSDGQGAAEWAFDSHLCVELLSRRDGRQPGGADRSEEWIRSRRRHESAAGEYLSRSRTRYRFENRPSSAQSGHNSELSQSHGRRRRLRLRTELQSSDRNL